MLDVPASRMISTNPRRFRLLALGVLAALAAASSAQAAPASYYLSLGGSVAVGMQPGANGRALPTGGYSTVLERALMAGHPGVQRVSLACAAETTTSLRTGGVCRYRAGSQLAAAEAFLRTHRAKVVLVTLAIGPDDLLRCIHGFSLTGPGFGVDAACYSAGLAGLQANLPAILRGLRTAAGPAVRIAALNSYDPGLALWLEGPEHHSDAISSLAFIRTLNAVLTRPLRPSHVLLADVFSAYQSASFQTSLSLAPFGPLPLPVARICQWTYICRAAQIELAYLPTDDGYRAIARAIAAAHRQ